MQLKTADETDVSAALGLFETAGTEAMRVGRARTDEPPSFSSTITSAWQVMNPAHPRR